MQSRPAALLVVLVLLAACAGAPDPEIRREFDPTLEQTEADLQRMDAQRRDFQKVLLDIDQAMDSYVRAMHSKGAPQAERHLERLGKMLRQLALDNYDRLCAAAADGSAPGNQSIALAALGFSGKREAMPVILQGAQLQDELPVNSAALGLAILQDPRTPPGVLAAVMDNPRYKEEVRVNAAWALYRVQESAPRDPAIIAIWLDVLGRPDHEVSPAIIANAVRGMGLTRDPQYGELVARFATHPTPRVRMITAIALGRMNAQDQVEVLLALLGPAETVQNVRLCAHEALVTLAGQVDRGYDVAEWRRVFQRK